MLNLRNFILIKSLFLLMTICLPKQTNAQRQQKYLSLLLVNDNGYNIDIEEENLAEIEDAKSLGYNSVSVAIRWEDIYRGGTNVWERYDKQINKAASLGMKVAIRIWTTANCNGKEGGGLNMNVPTCDGWCAAERMSGYDSEGNYRLLWIAGKTISSFAAQSTLERMQKFTLQVANRYKYLLNTDQLLYMSLATTAEQELGYPYNTSMGSDDMLEFITDYSETSLISFRKWLKEKYKTIDVLKSQWGENAKFCTSFDNVYPPKQNKRTGVFQPSFNSIMLNGAAGQDWYTFRHMSLKFLNNEFTKSVKSVDKRIDVICDYGSTYDVLSLKRNTYAFKDLSEGTDGIKINTGVEQDSRFSMDLARSNVEPGKWVMNEIAIDNNLDYIRTQFFDVFLHGADFIATFKLNLKNPRQREIIKEVVANFITENKTPALQPVSSMTYSLYDMLQSNGCYADRFKPAYAIYDCKVYKEWLNTYNNSGQKPVNIKIDETYLSSQNLITPTPLEACKKKIVFLGTEITKANPDSTTGWKNNWGQAASTLENDYAHLVSNKLRKVVHSNYDLDQLYINSEAWEKSTNTQVLETFFPDLIDRNADYIILQLGDKIINDNELAAFKTKYLALINWLKNNNISAKIVILTSFYPNNKASKLNQIISEIASTSSVYGVDISNLQLIKINTQTLNNSQVVPSDSGMKLIADLIWEKIDPYPNCPIPKLSVSKTFICKGATTTLTACGCSGNILWSNGKEGNPIYVEKGEYSAQCSQSTCKGINSPKISVFESQDCGATCDEGIAKPNAPSSYKGGIDINNCNIIEGWALNESGFGEASTVDIYIDNKKIASTIANLKYKDNGLGKAFFNDEANNRGFRYVLPDSVWYKDGTTRTVTAKFGGTSTFMFNFQPNQNNTINCPGKGLGYCGEKIIIIDSIPPISNRFSKSLIVYPNPTRGWVTVKVWEKKNEKGTLSVVDSNGRLIFEKTKDGKNDDLTFEFNFPKRYTAGTYFVKYNSSTQNDMKKIIFKR